MRDVVIIGGGLSGIAAAAALQERGIPYRLIEVRKRLGGSIISEARDGCLLDGGPFAFLRAEDWSFLPALGLNDALIPAQDSHRRDLVAFKGGTQVVIDALAGTLHGTHIHRMAISSIGSLNGRFTLCLENGLIWDAAAVIVAAPARHAERMLRTLAPQASARLLDYGYDTITRLSLVYHLDDLEMPPSLPWDMAVPFYAWTEHPARVPAGHVLLNVGIRYPLEKTTSAALIETVSAALKARGAPIVARVDYWPEADPLPPHTRHHAENIAALEAFLPHGLALAGSDYHGLTLAERIASGQRAAERIAQVWK